MDPHPRPSAPTGPNSRSRPSSFPWACLFPYDCCGGFPPTQTACNTDTVPQTPLLQRVTTKTLPPPPQEEEEEEEGKGKRVKEVDEECEGLNDVVSSWGKGFGVTVQGPGSRV